MCRIWIERLPTIPVAPPPNGVNPQRKAMTIIPAACWHRSSEDVIEI